MTTHAELTANDLRGYRSACPGLLRLLGTYPDRDFINGRWVERLVNLWGCECGQELSESGGRVENVYTRLSGAREDAPAPAPAPHPERSDAGPGLLFPEVGDGSRPGMYSDPDTGRGPG